jgi:hypothetical protein
MPTDTLPTIDLEALSRVSGGTTSNDQITAALSAITNSLSQLSASRNQSDPTMMMMMMMMMMNGGGGGGVVAGAPSYAAGAAGPPVINVDTSVLGRSGGLAGLLGGGGGYGGGGGCCGCGCKCW